MEPQHRGTACQAFGDVTIGNITHPPAVFAGAHDALAGSVVVAW
jgi:hypothetical protein